MILWNPRPEEAATEAIVLKPINKRRRFTRKVDLLLRSIYLYFEYYNVYRYIT